METLNKVEGGNGHSTATLPRPPASAADRDEASAREPARLIRGTEADVVTIERGAAGIVAAERAELRTTLAGVVFSSKEATVEGGLVRQVIAGSSVDLAKVGAGTVIAGGDVKVAQGGAGALLALGHMDIQQGGACGLVAGSATVARGGIVGVAMTPRLAVSDGGRVLVGPAGALGVIAGAAAGTLFGWLVGRARR